MPLRLEQKKTIVQEVAAIAQRSLSVVAVDYRGLPVTELTKLRRLAREQKVHLQVVRNTLARRALEGTEFECLSPTLTGPVLLAFSTEELSASARLIKEFAKGSEKIQVKALALSNQLFDSSQLDRVASLPTRLEAIAQLLGVLQAPITKLVRTLAEPQAKLVRALAAIRDQKQA